MVRRATIIIFRPQGLHSWHRLVTQGVMAGCSSIPLHRPMCSLSAERLYLSTRMAIIRLQQIRKLAGSPAAAASVSMRPQPTYQNGVVTQSGTMRTTPDVSYEAGPNQSGSLGEGVAVDDSYDYPGLTGPWIAANGTSVGAPQWAALIAQANQQRHSASLAPLTGYNQTLPLVYSMSSTDFHDITSGSNGAYTAGAGYDLVTGLGSPIANQVVASFAAVNNAESIVDDGDGGLYALFTNGDVYRMSSATGSVYLDDDVQSIAAAGDGGLYVLFDGGNLERYAYSSGWTSIHTNVQSIASGSHGVYVFFEGGDLDTYNFGSGWTPVITANDVKSIAAGADGGTYISLTNDNLDRYSSGTGLTTILTARNVASIAAGGDGGMYILLTNGNLDRYVSGSGLSLVITTNNVESIAAAGDGGLYFLLNNNSVDRYVQGFGSSIIETSGNGVGIDRSGGRRQSGHSVNEQ